MQRMCFRDLAGRRTVEDAGGRCFKKLKSFDLDARFEVEGGCLGILGASGCGKSMTLKAVAGLVKPDQGQIRRDGQVLFDSARKIDVPPRKRQVGYLFQNYALFPNMTVAENIEAGLLKGRLDREARKERMRELVRQFRLEGLENQYPARISGGQQQRTALARIFASDARCILLDERFLPWTAISGRRCRWSWPG
mgnify:CR=1 FL=1